LTLVDNRSVQNKSPLSLADLLQNVCEINGVDTEAIVRPGKERTIARARAIFCCLAVREYGYTGKEAGSVTGLGSAGVSIAVQRGEKLMKSEPSIREKIMEIGIIER